MGVDYEANFGIGFEVDVDENNPPDLEEYDDSLYEFMIGGLSGDFEDVFITYYGDTYSGERYYCITINKPLKEIAEKYDYYESELRKFVQQNHLKTTSEFGLVGGLLIW